MPELFPYARSVIKNELQFIVVVVKCGTHTRCRLQPVRLLRAPDYDEYIFFSERTVQCLNSSITVITICNEYIFMN